MDKSELAWEGPPHLVLILLGYPAPDALGRVTECERDREMKLQQVPWKWLWWHLKSSGLSLGTWWHRKGPKRTKAGLYFQVEIDFTYEVL